MDANEKLVRDCWEWCLVGEAQPFMGFKERDWVWQLPGYKCWAGFSSESEAWAAARAFTDAHKVKIAEVEEEIDYMRGFLELPDGRPHPVWTRIVAARQAVLADLRRGWRG